MNDKQFPTSRPYQYKYGNVKMCRALVTHHIHKHTWNSTFLFRLFFLIPLEKIIEATVIIIAFEALPPSNQIRIH